MEITAKQKKMIEQIAERHRLALVLLFGSMVSGKNDKFSDFDVAYLSERDLDLGEESKLIIELFPVFGTEQIDLANIKMASPLLLYGIFQNAQPLYEKEPCIFARYRAYAFKQYVETKPLYELKFQRLRERIKANASI